VPADQPVHAQQGHQLSHGQPKKNQAGPGGEHRIPRRSTGPGENRIIAVATPDCFGDDVLYRLGGYFGGSCLSRP
jgi:hypothetical protein